MARPNGSKNFKGRLKTPKQMLASGEITEEDIAYKETTLPDGKKVQVMVLKSVMDEKYPAQTYTQKGSSKTQQIKKASFQIKMSDGTKETVSGFTLGNVGLHRTKPGRYTLTDTTTGLSIGKLTGKNSEKKAKEKAKLFVNFLEKTNYSEKREKWFDIHIRSIGRPLTSVEKEKQEEIKRLTSRVLELGVMPG